jgi:hypothetical protein
VTAYCFEEIVPQVAAVPAQPHVHVHVHADGTVHQHIDKNASDTSGSGGDQHRHRNGRARGRAAVFNPWDRQRRDLVGSGLVNTWVLAGSIPALIGTDYGRLLLGKIGLFLVMLLLAAVNRLWLTPRLQRSDHDGAKGAAEQIGYNTLAEAALGAAIIVIVSVLGTLAPGLEGDAP